jgi:hypothetical protein
MCEGSLNYSQHISTVVFLLKNVIPLVSTQTGGVQYEDSLILNINVKYLAISCWHSASNQLEWFFLMTSHIILIIQHSLVDNCQLGIIL